MQGTFPASHSCSRTLEGQEGRRRGGRCRGAAPPPHAEHPAVYRGRLQLPCLLEVFKSSYHKQLMEFAFKLRKAGINKPNAECHEQACVAAACYSNILLPVSVPTESSWFLSCLLFCKHYRGTAAKKTFSLLPTLVFHFLPWSAPCSKLALAFKRQLCESNKPTAGLRKNPTKRKKLFFNPGQLSESPCSDKSADANLD